MDFVIQKAVLKQVPFQLYFRVRLRAAARMICFITNTPFLLNSFNHPITRLISMVLLPLEYVFVLSSWLKRGL